MSDRLAGAIAKLEGRCRELFRLKLEEKSFAEIQTLLGAGSLQLIPGGKGANQAVGVARLGYPPVTVGAPGFQAIVDELRQRGLNVTVETLTSWEVEQTPRSALEYIASRTWSRTWPTPDDVFAESIRQLTDWTERQYKGKMDSPRNSPHSFKVARAAVAR